MSAGHGTGNYFLWFNYSVLGLLFFFVSTSTAVSAPGYSRCLAVANNQIPVIRVSQSTAQQNSDVRITYVGHSTFLIESPGGIKIATDYTGYTGSQTLPNVVTMNHAHDSHYTDFPDPGIPHVLRGWNPEGGQAEHNLEVGDVRIRNVPTDIRNWSGETEVFGNSIFIFEVAGLCIGHLGHLHHELTLQHMGLIGNLDVVFVPVRMRGMDHQAILNVVKKLRPRLVIPMHYFDAFTLGSFLELAKPNFLIQMDESNSITVNVASLPSKMTIHVLPGN